jgi:1-aminocyclopropane-1-carboxylate deaminase/D-cysteine desulfhydrase-like pyridoxal-dependent ACC family enzyme
MAEQVAKEEKANGRSPYVVSVGGSRVGGSMTKPLGAIAYAAAFLELYRQSQSQGFEIDHVVLATGSGGTQAGLVVGAQAIAPHVKIVGISISSKKTSVQSNVAEIANKTAKALELDMSFNADDVIVFDDYIGEGYGKLDASHAHTIALVARKEGILLDPVYTGKAMAGTLDLIEKGFFGKDEGVVFLHTGGTPALFVYREELLELIK